MPVRRLLLLAAVFLAGVCLSEAVHHLPGRATPPAWVWHPPATVPPLVVRGPASRPTTYPSGEQVGPRGGRYHITSGGRKVYDRRG